MAEQVWGRIAVVGAGRLGTALCRAGQPQVGRLEGPFGRGFTGDHDGVHYGVIILAVPDAAIAAAANLIHPGRLVGHCAGSMGPSVIGDHEAFAMHPLMTIPRSGADFRGCGAAVDGSTPRALDFATALATGLGMDPVRIADEDRAAYHAAASIASNFLVTLEDAAETLLATCGGPRQLLVPLVRASLENWAAQGGAAALTGPIARGDDNTVARQRAAVAERTPHLLGLFDAMAEATRSLAGRA